MSDTSQNPVDLRALLNDFDAAYLPAASSEGPRDTVKAEVTLIDDAPSRVTASPASPSCFIDGIQASMTLAWRESRPVALHYAGAGASLNGNLLHSMEELVLVCSEKDELFVSTRLNQDVPLRAVTGETPTEVVLNVLSVLPGLRETLERDLSSKVLGDSSLGEGLVVCDGSIVGRPTDPRVVGVVKTTRSRYLQDESVLWSLPRHWRSQRFTIPAGAGGPVERHSCYLRLHDASHRPWDFALVRLEAFDPDILDALCALAIADSQDGSRPDSRWDRHLRNVRATEDLMRARRPALF